MFRAIKVIARNMVLFRHFLLKRLHNEKLLFY